MRILKKIAFVVLCLALLLLLLNWGASYYITKKLPSILNSEKDFPYNISYEDLDLDILGGNFTMTKAYLAPKDSLAANLQQGAFAEVGSIEVNSFNLWQLLRNDRIIVKKVTINSPDVILYDREQKYNPQDDFVKPFKNAITTGSLMLRNGRFRMLDSLQNMTVKASNINLDLFNIKIDSVTLEENIPARYRDYNFTCDSLFYRANRFYNLTAGHVASSDSTLIVDDFRMVPQQSREKFNSMIPEEKDQFNIQAAKISLPKVEWGFFNDTLYVHSPEITMEKVHANIYRGKMVKDDLTIKKLYSQLLRSLKFDLKVDKLLLKNSVVVYEEQLSYSKPPAKVSFSQFYATIANIYSPVRKEKMPNTVIDVQCQFMKSAPLKVNWFFNTLDTSDSFTITGHLQNIKTEEINPVTKPLMNATTEGDIEEVKFTFHGNRERAHGTFAIEYDDLKVDIYKKDGKKKNKLISAAGNLVVKNDSNDRLKKTDVAVDRAKDKSVFNFLWKFNEQGLKQSVLPKIIAGKGKKKKDKK